MRRRKSFRNPANATLTMLSILIPTYGFLPQQLVIDLAGQLKQRSFNWEIIVTEDASGKLEQIDCESINSIHPNVQCHILDQNLGRFAHRQFLARSAKYSRLLFIDDDAVMPEDFILKYEPYISSKAAVFGGMTYADTMPTDTDRHLRWKVGKKKEQIPARIRNEAPYARLQTCNFLIDKAVMLNLPSHKEISGYGHEDTMMGYDLRYAFVEVLHIDNPIEHSYIELSDVFMEKTEEAVGNLARLIKAGKIDEDVTLYRVYTKLKKTGMHRVLKWYVYNNRIPLLARLFRANPPLVLFDIYKLGILTKKLGDFD